MRVHFHDLRHKSATFLLAHGITPEDARNRLDQSSSVLTSNTCGHVLEQRQQKAAAAMGAALGGWEAAPDHRRRLRPVGGASRRGT